VPFFNSIAIAPSVDQRSDLVISEELYDFEVAVDIIELVRILPVDPEENAWIEARGVRARILQIDLKILI
jgi:hypothetical protein